MSNQSDHENQENRVAIVTGCLGGIGRAICDDLRDAGYAICGIDMGETPQAWHGTYLRCDLSNLGQIEAVVHSIKGGIHVLVNNAGIYKTVPFFDVTPMDYDLTMGVNARAAFFLSQMVARRMVEQAIAGTIINIASIAGKIGSTNVPYAASKAAVIAQTKSLARVLAPHGVRVNAVAPGSIATPMTATVNASQQVEQVPLGRQGQASEISSVVRFLAGSGAAYMTGAVVDVNGGWAS